MSQRTKAGLSLRFRHAPLRNILRVKAGDAADIAERKSRREIGRQVEHGGPSVAVVRAGRGERKPCATWFGS